MIFDAKEFKQALQKLKPFMSKEVTRYYLRGVYFHTDDKGKTYNLVATNGHILLRVNLENKDTEDNSSFIMDAKQVDMAIKLIPGSPKNKVVTVGKDDVSVCVDYYGTVVAMKEIDATYADYKKVIPEKKKRVAAFSPRYFEQVCKVFPSKDYVAIYGADKNSPHMIVSENATAVIMPTRNDEL